MKVLKRYRSQDFYNCYHLLTELSGNVFTPRFNPALLYGLYYSQERLQGLYRGTARRAVTSVFCLPVLGQTKICSNICVSNNSSGSPINPFSSTNSRLLPFPFFQRIVSCKKVGSILREARDRVVSLTADARSGIIACHVSAHVFFSPRNRNQYGGQMYIFPRFAPEENHPQIEKEVKAAEG